MKHSHKNRFPFMKSQFTAAAHRKTLDKALGGQFKSQICYHDGNGISKKDNHHLLCEVNRMGWQMEDKEKGKK